jgi:hypothetical protein
MWHTFVKKITLHVSLFLPGRRSFQLEHVRVKLNVLPRDEEKYAGMLVPRRVYGREKTSPI